MPELPEVETVVRDLRPRVVGRRIVAVIRGRKALRQPWRRAWSDQVRGHAVAAVARRGKWILFSLDDGQALLAHLGMTGRLEVALAKAPRPPHVHLRFRLDDGREELRFHDPRRFGLVALLDAYECESFLNGGKLGPEPFKLMGGDWFARLRGTRRCLKAVLLDQRVVAGVGNIYADEALYRARLSPCRLGMEVSRAEAERLRRAIVQVLARAIERKGATIRNFLYGDGASGAYQREFRVYQQTGKPCPRCRAPIACIRLAGRATHYCPRCQASSPGGGT